MTRIVEIPGDQVATFVEIVSTAYPGIKLVTAEDKQRYVQRLLDSQANDPMIHLYGLYRNDELLGGMRLFDFTLNAFGTQIPLGGVGLVAVHLLHKKEHVARDMIAFFLRQYHERGAAITALYPFRPDFYKQMGFGYGAKQNQYRIKPAHLPRGSRDNIVYLTPADAPQMHACYDRFFARTHGMIARPVAAFTTMLNNPESRVVGVRRDGAIRAYVQFGFKPVQPDNFLRNDLVIHELVYEDSAALHEILALLHAQADQFDTVLYNTQDDHFLHLVFDPRNGSGNNVGLYHDSNVQGIGLMYRVLDTRRLFAQLADHNWNGQTCTLKLTIADSFFPDNHGSTIVHFRKGVAQLPSSDEAEVEVQLDVADFSSLVMGAIPFSRLHSYGLARISDPAYVPTLNRLFAADKPICMTRF